MLVSCCLFVLIHFVMVSIFEGERLWCKDTFSLGWTNINRKTLRNIQTYQSFSVWSWSLKSNWKVHEITHFSRTGWAHYFVSNKIFDALSFIDSLSVSLSLTVRVCSRAWKFWFPHTHFLLKNLYWPILHGFGLQSCGFIVSCEFKFSFVLSLLFWKNGVGSFPDVWK